jgi:predicted SprT family Zn-dependent metalloprotease
MYGFLFGVSRLSLLDIIVKVHATFKPLICGLSLTVKIIYRDAKLVQSLIQQRFLELQNQYPELRNWTLKFDSARRRAGACFPGKKLLTISLHHIELNDWVTIKDTLVHEIAHALAWEQFGERGHGPNWRRLVSRLGGQAKATGRFNLPQAHWVIVWRDVERQQLTRIADRFRRSRSIRYWALKNRPESLGQLHYISHRQYQAWQKGELSFSDIRFYQ